ncbi:adenylyltransferase and sulfurtransferase MOCS3-like [Liolophura sinensis]|uniref:adenylyltransferase and sulfurtransferase MOCS3-like n=1 Tax=Liolophura sinensis TaxID=3198878 RepID=UPI0031583461
MAEKDELHRLRTQLEEKDKEIAFLRQKINREAIPPIISSLEDHSDIVENRQSSNTGCQLDNESILRYSRQLILPEIGVKGQLLLEQSSVLVVGAGGLGCPVAVYLAAAGVGRLGLVDYDEVELSNLHRQILHTEPRVGVSKSASASFACQQLNSRVKCIPYHLQLDSSNALQIIQQYNIIVDATDNVATRYLLNDACVLSRKPLVSGSALRFEGQLTVYNHDGGPCYRCLYPSPPPPETVTNCSDGGVLGVVPGIIGCLQALEVIKIVTQIGSSYTQKLLLFDGLDGAFRQIRLRGRQKSCVVCGDSPSITRLIDYVQFCGAGANDKEQPRNVLKAEDRISVKEYSQMLEECIPHVLVDVRQPVELDICKLPQPAINIPIDKLQNSTQVPEPVMSLRSKSQIFQQQHGSPMPVVMVCRHGNDSQLAVHSLRRHLQDCPVTIKDIQGGLNAWAHQIDPEFPVY